MGRDNCRMPNCEREPEDNSKFCSDKHEVLYDKRRSEAREAKRDAEREAEVHGDPGMSQSEFRNMVL